MHQGTAAVRAVPRTRQDDRSDTDTASHGGLRWYKCSVLAIIIERLCDVKTSEWRPGTSSILFLPSERESRAMHILVAPQEFKGSLTAVEAASAIAAG
ncbi:MAG: hypothetical protein WD359_08350, partial [Dehalococcoidia bacterium]